MAEEIFEIQESGDGKSMVCPDFFDISVAQQLHQVLQEIMKDQPESLSFDISQVEMIDTSILQTLCAFKRDASNAGIKIHWKNANDVVCKSAGLLGMDGYLELECA